MRSYVAFGLFDVILGGWGAGGGTFVVVLFVLLWVFCCLFVFGVFWGWFCLKVCFVLFPFFVLGFYLCSPDISLTYLQ